jgi:hypothetical protein
MEGDDDHSLNCPECRAELPKDELIAKEKARKQSKAEPDVGIELSEVQIKHIRQKAASLVLRGKKHQDKWAALLGEQLGARTAPTFDDIKRISSNGIVIPESVAKRFWDVFFHRSKEEKAARRERRARELAKAAKKKTGRT